MYAHSWRHAPGFKRHVAIEHPALKEASNSSSGKIYLTGVQCFPILWYFMIPVFISCREKYIRAKLITLSCYTYKLLLSVCRQYAVYRNMFKIKEKNYSFWYIEQFSGKKGRLTSIWASSEVDIYYIWPMWSKIKFTGNILPYTVNTKINLNPSISFRFETCRRKEGWVGKTSTLCVHFMHVSCIKVEPLLPT